MGAYGAYRYKVSPVIKVAIKQAWVVSFMLQPLFPWVPWKLPARRRMHRSLKLKAGTTSDFGIC
jgi:hypothetical protein